MRLPFKIFFNMKNVLYDNKVKHNLMKYFEKEFKKLSVVIMLS